jgi:hypothetical protein
MRAHDIKDPQILMESAARTATHSITFNTPCLGGLFVIDVTAVAATPSVTFTIAGVDPASDKTWTILASAAITGTGTTVLRIHPELTAAANTIAKDMLPHAIKVTATHADADSITYSLGFIGTM